MPTNPSPFQNNCSRRFVAAVALYALALLASPSFADDALPAVVLVPVYTVSAVGALGSLWETQFAIRNDSGTAILYTPLSCPFPCLGLRDLAPKVTAREDAVTPAEAFEGRIVRFNRADLSGVKFALRGRDTSRNGLSAGTELPVVHESEFAARIVLLDVPTDSRFRHSLRVYSLDHGVSVRLRIFSFNGAIPLVDQTLTLLEPADTLTTPVQLSLHGLLARYPQVASESSVRIELDGVADARLWAFVSITNNQTQEFTIVSPQ